VLYLLVTRRYRAALTAIATAAGATVLAMLVAPDASREFWTDALWDTDRVGTLSFISNQSLEGLVARLSPTHPSSVLWAALVLVTLGVWAWRARLAVRAGDDLAGVALTGVAACLVSPVTWIHHLVWLMPALLLLFDRGLLVRGRRGWTWLGIFLVLYALLCSRLVWVFGHHFTDIGILLSNAYVVAAVILLLVLPIRGTPISGQLAGVPDLGQVDHGPVRPADGVAGVGTVEREPGPLVEPSGLAVVRQHP
jgi:alpha-1,2-mannosyltransferase